MPITTLLPAELILLIAEGLPLRTLSKLSRTCHSFHKLITALLTARFTRDGPEIIKNALDQNDTTLFSHALAFIPDPPQFLASLLRGALQDSNVKTVVILLEAGARWRWFHEVEFKHWMGAQKDKKGIEELRTRLERVGGYAIREDAVVMPWRGENSTF